MENTKKILHWVLGLAVLGVIAWMGVTVYRDGHALAGSTSPSSNPSTNFTFVEVSDGLLSDGFLSIGSTTPSGQNPTAVESTSNITQRVTSGTCGAATTTLFSVASPMTSTASSTALVIIRGTGNATTTSLQVGTTTASTGLTAATVSSTLMNASVATTSPFYLFSGLTGAGAQTSAGASTFREIAVGPSERVGAFATTTATGAGAANFTGGFTSCTYRILWTQ